MGSERNGQPKVISNHIQSNNSSYPLDDPFNQPIFINTTNEKTYMVNHWWFIHFCILHSE